jgi:hypothetical protein
MMAFHSGNRAPRRLAILVTLALASVSFASGQGLDRGAEPPLRPSAAQGGFLGTSLFVLSSLIPDSGSLFAELDYGRRLKAGDAVLLGADVWRYESPMADPWSSAVLYPGSILSYGIILGYQAPLWKGLYAGLLCNALALDYADASGRSLGRGFQLMTTLRLGYHVEFSLFGLPCYLEPAGELNWWPVNTGVPESFAAVDRAYHNYVFSPALNFGVLLR